MLINTFLSCNKYWNSFLLNSVFSLCMPNCRLASKRFLCENKLYSLNITRPYFRKYWKPKHNFKTFSTRKINGDHCNSDKTGINCRKIFGIGLVLCFGHLLIKKIINVDGINSKFEYFNEWSYDWVIKNLINRFIPPNEEPLLPDFEQLGYPENLPTLVVGLRGIICDISHTRKNGWGVVKRPGADKFFEELKHYYEILIWSDELFPIPQEIVQKWNLPVVGVLDRSQFSKKDGKYFKDLRRLGRNLERVVLLDSESELVYSHPENSITLNNFKGDLRDNELESIIDLLKATALHPGDVRKFLEKFGGNDRNVATRFNEYKKIISEKSNKRRKFNKFLPK